MSKSKMMSGMEDSKPIEFEGFVETPEEVKEEPKEEPKPKKVDKSLFPKYNGTSSRFTDALLSFGERADYDFRMKIAKANGINNYLGLGKDNLELLNLMKDGKLKRP